MIESSFTHLRTSESTCTRERTGLRVYLYPRRTGVCESICTHKRATEKENTCIYERAGI